MYSNIHKFDILRGASIEYAVTLNLAATDPQDHTSSYKEGYWGEIGVIYSISPQSRRILAAWRWWGISRILGRFWCAVIGTPIFFCFNHRSCNAAHPTALRIRCHHFRGVKTTLVNNEVEGILSNLVTTVT